MIRSIRTQFLLPLAILMVAFVAICIWTAKSAADSARLRVVRQIEGVIRVLENASFPLSDQVLRQMKNLSGGEFILEEPSGARRGTLDGDIQPVSDSAASWFTIARPWGDRVVVQGRRYLRRSVVLTPPSPQARARLSILYPESLWEEALWHAVRPTLLLGAAGGVSAVVLMVIGARSAIQSLRELERRTRQIADGDFRPVALPQGPDEIRRLAVHINDMASRLQQMKEAITTLERDRLLSQVTSGWAHQLRNATTGARLALQIHAQHCRHDPDSMQVAERQLGRIERDLQRFLDWKRGVIREDVFPAKRLIEETVELVRPRCQHAGIRLSWRVSDDALLSLRGDFHQLTHLLLNIVNNALDAAGPGGWVEITVHRQGSTLGIDVDDSGPGPPDEIQQRLFEPFVTSKPGGIGLGLAFAAQVAEAHRGRISWSRTHDERTRFRIELPIETPE